MGALNHPVEEAKAVMAVGEKIDERNSEKIGEAIKERRSVRRFLPRPVPQDVIRSVLETARHSPSSMNSQPWEFYVATGRCLDALKAENLRRLRAGDAFEVEFNSALWPKDSVFRTRQVDLAKQLFQALGIAREDKEKRAHWFEQGFRYFHAPAAIFLTADTMLSQQAVLFDMGMVAQTVCLAALDHGLGTCVEQQGVSYASTVREIVGIPASRHLVIAIALGYPDWDFPANNITVERTDIEDVLVWAEDPASGNRTIDTNNPKITGVE